VERRSATGPGHLIVGVAAASASKGVVLIAGASGLVAGALSMAAGEYVSVRSQRDAERADIGKRGRSSLRTQRASFTSSPGSTESAGSTPISR
jgi:VIT1/CCC1 family predicted Fe2+/Mn2+ transporter